jgi:hypothetical protein
MTEVFEKVYLGDIYVAQNAWLLKHLNISHVLNVTDTLKNYFDNKTVVEVKILRRAEKKAPANASVTIDEVEATKNEANHSIIDSSIKDEKIPITTTITEKKTNIKNENVSFGHSFRRYYTL